MAMASDPPADPWEPLDQPDDGAEPCPICGEYPEDCRCDLGADDLYEDYLDSNDYPPSAPV